MSEAVAERPFAKAFLQDARRTLKYSIIRTGLEAIAVSGARAAFPSAGGRGVIFTLHHVRPQTETRFDPNGILSVTPDFLERAILAARDCGLTPVALHDLPRFLADDADRRRFVAFTLDDGYRDNAEFAAPMFRKHGVPYTIFITAGFVERTRTIWWETAEALLRHVGQVTIDLGSGEVTIPARKLADKRAAFDRIAAMVQSIDEDEAVARIDRAAVSAGIDPTRLVDDLVMDARELRTLTTSDPLASLGAHTLTHCNLRRVAAIRLKEEITASAQAVERYCGRFPQSFSYPYGWASAADEREFDAAERAGFSVAVTTQPGVLGPPADRRMTALPRVSLNGHYQKRRYVKALVSGLPFKMMR